MARSAGVRVEHITKPSSNWHAHDGLSLRKTTTGTGANTTVIWDKSISREIFIGGTPADLIKAITEAAVGVKDAYMDLERYNEAYDSTDYHRVVIKGWVEATEEEIQIVSEYAAKQNAAREISDRERAEKDIARLRVQYPDMF